MLRKYAPIRSIWKCKQRAIRTAVVKGANDATRGLALVFRWQGAPARSPRASGCPHTGMQMMILLLYPPDLASFAATDGILHIAALIVLTERRETSNLARQVRGAELQRPPSLSQTSKICSSSSNKLKQNLGYMQSGQ